MASHTLHKPIKPNQADLHAFLWQQLELLARERQAEIDQTSLLASNCSQKELERRGLSLGGLAISSVNVGLGGKTIVELHRPLAYHTSPLLPVHTFRSGDPARLEPLASEKDAKKRAKGKDHDDHAAEGVVHKVSKETVTLALDAEQDTGELPDRLRLIKLANSATFDRMEATLRHLARIVLDPGFAENTSMAKSVFNEDLVRALLGLREPTWSSSMDPSSGLKFLDETLNDSQKEAVSFALRADQVACIHGPPGTGKTFTLVEIIRQLLSLGKRVLVCGASNLAVDNLLARLSLHVPETLLRLGHPARISTDFIRTTLDYKTAESEEGEIVKDVKVELEDTMKTLAKKRGEKGAVKGKERFTKWQDVKELRKEYREREAKVVKNVVTGAQVVLATCHGAGSRQIANMQFDVCIIDEATQAVEAVCWIPVLKAKKLILAGDPMQLPPTILSANHKGKKKVTVKMKPLLTDSGDSVETTTTTSVESTIPPSGIESDEEIRDGINNMTPPNGKSSASPARLGKPRTLEITLFDRLEKLYGPGIKRMLKTQYRMNETISSFPSAALYASELRDAPSVAQRRLVELPSIADPTSEAAQDALHPTVIFFDTAGCEMYERNAGDDGSLIGDGSRYNENEAEIVARWVRELTSHGVPEKEIAIVTPYQAQVSHLASMLREDFPDLSIGSVDGMQGQEREAIILSLVRSNAKKEVGFLAEQRRLNVAMTRAKRQLCVVGDSSTVSQGNKYLKSWMSWLEEHADVRWPGDP